MVERDWRKLHRHSLAVNPRTNIPANGTPMKTLPERMPLLVAALSFSLLAACTGPSAPAPPEFRVPVEILEVSIDSIEEVILTSGTLRTKELVEVNNEVPGAIYIASDASGRRLREGSRVASGDLIAQITGEDARIHAQIDRATQALKTAEAELQRAEDLFERKLVPEAEVFSKRSSYESAKLEADRAKLNTAKARLITPIGGTILSLARNQNGLPLADGNLIGQGFKVATIGPMHPLIADIDLVGPELARIRTEQPARVRHFAFEDHFVGKVLHLAPTLNAESHTFRAEVLVDNPEELLRPGMYVEVVIVTKRQEDVPVIPREALATRSGKVVAFVLDGQRAERRELRIGLRDDEKVEVMSGLELGDRVIVRGLETLTDRTRVRVVGS